MADRHRPVHNVGLIRSMSDPATGCDPSQCCRVVILPGLVPAQIDAHLEGEHRMSIVADTYRFVVGVDTHAAAHRYAIIETPNGRLFDEATFPTSAAGLRRAEAWIGRRAGGDIDAVLVSAEGTGSYGAQMAARLSSTGYRVVDAPAPQRDRGTDKNDPIDAIKAARGALIRDIERLADVRNSSMHTALSVLTKSRDHMSLERTRAINALTALLRIHDLDIDARKALTRTQIRQVAAWRTRTESLDIALTRTEAVRLARRIRDLDADLASNNRQLTILVTEYAPQMMAMPGVGPVCAAIILTAWSQPGRIHSESALARLGGTCPIETSSGAHSGHRLNRGGDRQLNRAIHTIAMVRMRSDAQTRDYVHKRVAEGLTRRSIQRCLKRYITRQIYRTLTDTTT